MKIRWFIYLVIGIVFGVFDFYFHSFISNVLVQGETLWTVLTYGVWLVPIVPIALYEVRISKSSVRSALASSSTWLVSIIFYYLCNAIQLGIIGRSTRPELHISNHKDPFFWGNWKNVFWEDIVIRGIVEWSVVAVTGGFIVGFSVGFIYLRLEKLIKLRRTTNEDF
ncbi:hypothetical protein SRABI80_00728 [Peribacillus frigoritolerans]|uniref:hypothetical protein n=1 Tax=Peribacillus frigoritolerans TaxID=450367 RepID=UPI001D4A00C6|nr:hypothetical protein [Peribacillus frigoritolerans]CAH0155275.1 hypothetical protein SRABI80_00728 [Peribacillus frigoritolerans]